MPEIATEQDVQGADSSTAEIEESEVIQYTEESIQDQPEAESEEVQEVAEAEEVPEATEETEEVVAPVLEETPTKTVPRIPLPRLQKEISKRKELQKQLDELRSKEPSHTAAPIHDTPQGEKEPTMPTLASSGYDETAYQAAMAAYSKDLVKHEIKASQIQAQAQADKAAQEQARVSHQNRIEEFMSESAEYQQVIQEIVETEEEIEYPPAVAEALSLSENGPQLDYLILKNRETLLPKLQGLQPFQQLIEIGKLEAQVGMESSPKPKSKPISKAPAPIKSSASGARSTSDDILKSIDPHFKMY